MSDSEESWTTYETAPSTPRCDTPNFQPLTENDTVVAVMGPTGAGKSTFIKLATGAEDVQIDHGLDPCAAKVQAVRYHDPNGQRDVVFVDTPAFDPTDKRDTAFLESIVDWLEKTYRTGVKLSGVLYLHRITDNRVTNTVLRNLDMFNKLCGDDALSNVVFVTTNWDRLEQPDDIEEGIRREEELSNTLWKPFLDSGSQALRFEYNCASAWNIVSSLPLVRMPLEIQREMVDQGKRWDETTVGQSLSSRLQNVPKELVHRLEYLPKKVTSSGGDDRSRGETFKQLQETITASREDEQQRDQFLPSRRFIRDSASSSVAPSPFGSTSRVAVYDVYDELEKKVIPRFQRGWGFREHGTLTTSSIGESGETDYCSSSPPAPCDVPDIDCFLEGIIESDPKHIQAKGLIGTIQVLKLTRTAVAGVPVPGLQRVIGVALGIAESLSEMKDTDHSLVILMSNTGQLVRIICDQVRAAEGYPKSVTDTVDDFHRELLKIFEISEKIKAGGKLQRYVLRPDDQRAIIGCNKAMKLALHRLGVSRTKMKFNRPPNTKGSDNSSRSDTHRIRVMELLDNTLQQRAKKKALKELIGPDAQLLINYLDSISLEPAARSGPLHKERVKALYRLSKSSQLYPQQYILCDVIKASVAQGAGGLCDIFPGKYRDQDICLKVIRVYRNRDIGAAMRVLAKEAILWGQLCHPNIVPFYGLYYVELDSVHRACLVSPWMKNGNLVEYLREHPDALREPLAYDVTCGLDYLHQESIIHGDLKGVNILVSDAGVACITDFGLSSVAANDAMMRTLATTTVNRVTFRWVSPEVFEDSERRCRASDVWALGCVFYEIFTRRLPFYEHKSDATVLGKILRGILPTRPTEGRSEVRDLISNEGWSIMSRCWAFEPEERPTCQQLLTDMKALRYDIRFGEREIRDANLSVEFRLAMRTGGNAVPVDLRRVEEILMKL